MPRFRLGMVKRLFLLLVAASLSAQTVTPVSNGKLLTQLDANGQDLVKADEIKFGPANDVTLARSGAGAITLTGALSVTGAVDFPSSALAWADLNKTGSSLADLTTRSAADLSSGVLLAARLPASGVVAGSGYNQITVDSTGRVTAAAIADYVTTSRTVSTLAPLSGGSDLSSNLTLSVTAASDAAVGVVELATPAEVVTGTDSSRAVTPAGSAAAIAAISASNIAIGTLPAARLPAFTGDVTTSAGSVVTTLATVNSNVGAFGSATATPTFTVNAKGLITAATSTTVTPAWASVTSKPVVIAAGSTQELARQAIGIGEGDQPVWESITVGTSGAVGDILFAHDTIQLDSLRPSPGAADRVVYLPATSGTLANTAEVAAEATLARNAANLTSGTVPAARMPALTGDATTSAGAVSVTITNDAVSNTKLANMATATIKGRTTAGTGDPEDLSPAQARTVLALTAAATGDASGLTSGLLPTARLPAATDSVIGAVMLATPADVVTGTGSTKAVTSAGVRAGLAAYADPIAATRALVSYGLSDGVTSGRGIIYSNATRQAIAGVPMVQLAIDALIPSSNPSATAWLFNASNSASPEVANSINIRINTAGAMVVLAYGNAPATDYRTFTYAGFRAAYSGLRTRLSITFTKGTTNPVVKANGTDISAFFVAATGAGTTPDWLDANLTSSVLIAGYTWPAGDVPRVTPILGALSTAEETEYWATGRLPAWVMLGGSGVGLVSNTGFEVDTTGWAALSASISRTTADFNTGVACAEVVVTGGGQGIRTDIGALPTTRVLVASFWAKSVSGNTTLTASRANGSSAQNYTLTGAWQRFTYISTSGTLLPSLNTNLVVFYLAGAGTFRLDDVQIWQAGAFTSPAYQPLHVARDMTLIGGNQGRLVGITPILAVAQDGSRIEVPSQSFTGALSVNILGGAINANKTQRIISITGNSSASTTISIGTSTGGTQLVNAQPVNGNFDISTIASRFFASGSSIWITFAATTTANVTINTSDI